MLTSLEQILEKAQIPLQNSVYNDVPLSTLYWPIVSGDFFGVEQVRPREEENVSENHIWMQQLSNIHQQLKMLKNEQEDLTHAHAAEIQALRQRKKELYHLLQTTQPYQPARWAVTFKSCLYATAFSTICRYLPSMRTICLPYFQHMLWFTANLSSLQQAVLKGRSIAISGGPCLFGVDEVHIIIHRKSGERECYDFSSGLSAQYALSDRGLAEALASKQDPVIHIDVVNRKQGLTSQEYDSIHCLFICAKALQARLAIPLPDMSYLKYFHNITANLSPALSQDAMYKFRQAVFSICDRYLQLIDLLKAQYPEVEVAVVHERDTVLCRQFYQRRKPFLKHRLVRNLTQIVGKKDSILDYITMPALPYYLWGVTDIIQMDSLDEADSYRKCRKLHKSKIKLYAMLYPERLSQDGIHTIFYAPLPYKEYMI